MGGRTLPWRSWCRSLPLAGLLLLMLFPAGGGWSSSVSRAQGGSPPVRQRRVLAERFHFTPDSIELKLGTRLRIQLSSRDTFHGFQILGTEINVEIPARGKGKVEVEFEPTRAGVYTFVCSKRCGAGHTEMRGRIIVKAGDGSLPETAWEAPPTGTGTGREVGSPEAPEPLRQP